MTDQPHATFYVATNGNDEWSGRYPEPNAAGTEGPFATIARARDAIRAMPDPERVAHPITVMVRGAPTPSTRRWSSSRSIAARSRAPSPIAPIRVRPRF